MHMIESRPYNSSLALEIDIDSYVVSLGGKPIDMTFREYILLEKMFLTDTWVTIKSLPPFYFPNIVDLRVLAHRLKSKLARLSGGTHFIQVVNKKGYQLIASPVHVMKKDSTPRAIVSVRIAA